MWDYSASIVSKLGHRRQFLLPDRSKYVNMENHFLKSYLGLVVQTCHRRGCIATVPKPVPFLTLGGHGRQGVFA